MGESACLPRAREGLRLRFRSRGTAAWKCPLRDRGAAAQERRGAAAQGRRGASAQERREAPARELPTPPGKAAARRRSRAIVLDLDRTLIFTPDGSEWASSLDLKEKRRVLSFKVLDCDDRGSGSFSWYHSIKRPHLEEFLAFCSAEFDFVIVWSAGERNYVLPIVRALFRDFRRPNVVWTRDEMHEDSKPLEDLLRKTDLPESVSMRSIMLVDDIRRNFSRNLSNGVLIPPFTPPATRSGILGEDRTLLQLKSWLSRPEVRSSQDVRALAKGSIFEN